MFPPDFKEVQIFSKELKPCYYCGYDHKSETAEAQKAHEFQAKEIGCLCSLAHRNENVIFRGNE